LNTPYFVCPNCRVYIDAGYRWAYWRLEEPGVVTHNGGVDIEAVLARAEYWNPPEEERSEWLCERVLPSVRRFLSLHGTHGIVYTDEGVILNEDSLYYNWSEVET
jgi:hypothetical protein